MLRFSSLLFLLTIFLGLGCSDRDIDAVQVTIKPTDTNTPVATATKQSVEVVVELVPTRTRVPADSEDLPETRYVPVEIVPVGEGEEPQFEYQHVDAYPLSGDLTLLGEGILQHQKTYYDGTVYFNAQNGRNIFFWPHLINKFTFTNGCNSLKFALSWEVQ